MTLRELLDEPLGLDPRRVAQLAVANVADLAALARADPAAFARYFELADPGPVIARLEAAVPAAVRAQWLPTAEEPEYPVDGVPFEHWPPAEPAPEENAGQRSRKRAARRASFHARPPLRRVESHVDTVEGFEIVASSLVPVEEDGSSGGGGEKSYEVHAPDGTIIANALASLPAAYQRVHEAVERAAGKARPCP